MNRFLCLLAAGLYLCFQCHVDAGSFLSRNKIERAVNAARARVDSAYAYSRRETIERVRRRAGNPSDIMRLLRQPSGPSRSVVRAADYMDNAISLIKASLGKRHKRSLNATDKISEDVLQTIADLTGCSPRHRVPSCKTTPNLDKYRTASSVCNNRKNTRWGSSNIPFVRWLPPMYEDNISVPRGWTPDLKINGHTLPLVRNVSNHILRTKNSELEDDRDFSFLLTVFGQWTDHDLTLAPHAPVICSFNDGLDCEKSCERSEPCFPIEVPKGDPRLNRKSDECLPFFRSSPGCGTGNTGHFFGGVTVREQVNVLTSFIDVGQVYGSDDAKARFLRNLTTDEGLLRVNTEYDDNGRELLPFEHMPVNMCATRRKVTKDDSLEETPCFVAGDERVNENIGLTSLHTLFLREHNRLARALAKLNPHWYGERLYQEARKIMGAYLQIITFRDFLLHILGPDVIAKHLSTYPGYDEEVNPGIGNVFATAAFRVGHTMVQPNITRLDEQYKEHPLFPSTPLHRAFFTPWRLLFEGGVDPVLRGLMGNRAKRNTQKHIVTDELTERLFELTSELAMDLASLNMQRGRDHGIPGYNQWRKFCGLSQPQTVEELTDVMNNPHLAKNFMDLYGTPDNIDVWVGAVAEPSLPGARVGSLLACLISKQFKRIRQGDRLWWENKGVFTEAQRKSLRKTSLARIICDNTGITELPDKPFQFRERMSGYTDCKDIPVFDLSPWKEGAPCESTEPSGHPEPRVKAKIAFTVRLYSSTVRPGEPIVFSEAIYNEQDSYNTKTGYFVCEVPGLYEFNFHCTINKVSASLDLMRNDERILHAYTTKHEGSLIASGDTYIKLKKGDRVYMVTDIMGQGLSSDSYFSGHLVYANY